MSQIIDVHLDFRSPYSYLATPELPSLRDNFDVDVRLKYGLPLAISKPDFFRPENASGIKYILMDWERRAEILGLPHGFPSPDPIVQNLETLEISKDQPHIYRVTYMGMEAERLGKGIEFAIEVFRLIWGGTVNWQIGPHLHDAASRCGLDFAEIEKAITNTSSYDREISENHEARISAGHWGVPTFVVNGEPFFGQDRIETLRWRLEKLGLRRSAK
jgi:2-hydroxychromene-2-carboxylate isomerase